MALVSRESPPALRPPKHHFKRPRFRAPADINSYPYLWDLYPYLDPMDFCPGERLIIDERGFQVDIDVSQYKPHEVVVKSNEDYVVIEANHEKHIHSNSLEERHFMRRYLLPRGFNANDVFSSMSAEGILTIKVPAPPPSSFYAPHARLVRINDHKRRDWH